MSRFDALDDGDKMGGVRANGIPEKASMKHANTVTVKETKKYANTTTVTVSANDKHKKKTFAKTDRKCKRYLWTRKKQKYSEENTMQLNLMAI